MPKISLILLDLNGVLYRYDRDARIAHLARLSGRAPADILAAIWQSGFEDDGDAGAFDEATYLHEFGSRIGYPLSEAEWLDAQLAALSPLPDSLALLDQLDPALPLAVLTNNNLLIRRHIAALYPAIATRVAGRCHVSAEFAARKPGPEVFQRCLARLGVTPATTLFIDDSAANVAGARQAGLHGHHFVSVDAMAAELARLGLISRAAPASAKPS
jgi:HAD superfamily hydrolase (TIGR01509 family)